MNKIVTVAAVVACAFYGTAGTVSYTIPVLSVKSDGQKVIPGSGKANKCAFSFVDTTNKTPVKVSIVEDVPVGTGNAMRSSLWLAVTTAALALNQDLSGETIRFETSGYVDGPSAGGMICLAVMSAMEGRLFPDDFAMTGTIMADGTIGPVGGVAEKIKAASKAGIKRVCIPAFTRIDENDYTDLLELGKELKLDVRQVATIDDAYQVLHRLPARHLSRLNSVNACQLPNSVENVLKNQFLHAVKRGDKDMWDAFLDKAFSEYMSGMFGAAVMRIIEGYDTRSSAVACDENYLFEAYPEIKYELPTNSLSNAEGATENSPTREQFVKALMKMHGDLKSTEEAGSDELEKDNSESVSPKDCAKVNKTAEWFDDYVEHPSAAQFVTLGNHLFLKACVLDMERQEITRGINDVRDWSALSAEQLNAIRAQLVEKFGLLRYVGTLDVGGENYERLNILYSGLANSIPYIRPNASTMQVENAIYCTMKAMDAALKEDGLLDDNKEIAQFYESCCTLAETTRAKRLESETHMLKAVFTDVQFLATACALTLARNIRENSAFFNSVISTARENAIANILDCQKMDIPCVMPVIYFQSAESQHDDNVVGDDAEVKRLTLLESYLHISLAAKALVLCFSGQNPELNAKGYCSKSTIVYDNGSKLKVSYYGVNGELILRDGFSGYRKEFDEGGLAATYWLDLAGRDVRFKSTNVCCTAVYDDNDRLVRKTYCNTSWFPTPNNEGVLFETFEYDAAGNRTSWEFFGTSSNHVNCADGMAVIRSRFNGRGQETHRRFYDAGGQPVRHKDGNAGFDIVYDKRGNQRVFTYVDEAGKPMMTQAGYAMEERKYNAYDCETEKTWFDEHGKSVCVEGIARIRSKYDDSQNATEIAYFDTNDRLMCCAEKYAIARFRYNRNGEMVECHFYGPDGKPTMCKNGYASWKDVFDATGRKVGCFYYDLNGKKIDINQEGVMKGNN